MRNKPHSRANRFAGPGNSRFFLMPAMFLLLFSATEAQNTGRGKQIRPAVPKDVPGSMEGISPDRFTGMWKERMRRNLISGEYFAFTDTLLISFENNYCVISVFGTQASTIRGQAEFAGDEVLLAEKRYSVKKFSDEEWTIADDLLEVTLVRVDDNLTDPGNTVTATPAGYGPPTTPDFSVMPAKWTVYKREGKAEAVNGGNFLIEQFELEWDKKSKSLSGYITYLSNNISVTQDCRLIFDDASGHFSLETGSFSRDMYSFTCDAHEWVFGNPEDVIYRARK